MSFLRGLFCLALILIGALLVYLLPAAAQGNISMMGTATPPPVTLAYGQTVTGTLDDTHFEDRWTFAGQRGDSITLVMERAVDEPGGLDGYLLLLGPDGSTLDEVDDSTSSVMPRLGDFVLPGSGLYTVVATRFGFQSGFSSGKYSLTLTKNLSNAELLAGGHGSFSELPTETRLLLYNEPAVGTLSNDRFEAWYAFMGRAGDVITLRMQANQSDLDSYVALFDASGRELASNDDESDTVRDAVIADFVLPVEGQYLIRATRYGFRNGPSVGEYTLTIETEAESYLPGENEAARELMPSLGQEGSLGPGQIVDQFQFTGQAGEVVTISVRRMTGDLKLALVLHGPDDQEMAFSRGWYGLAADESEVRIARLALPQSGVYRVDVTLEDLNTSGNYGILLIKEAQAVTATAVKPMQGVDIELVLTWQGPADLDLMAASRADGGSDQRSDSANDFCSEALDAPLERVVWKQAEEAPAGVIEIGVSFVLDCAGQGEPVPFVLTIIRQGAVVDVIGGTLAREGDRYVTWLDATPG